MTSKYLGWSIALMAAMLTAACGGGGGGSPAVIAAPPTLVSIALSPLTATVPPGGTEQLTVTGTYSDGSTQVLASGETFVSSATTVATVNSAGLVTVAASATNGSTATITATDTASGDATSTASSTVVTVGSSGPPTSGSVSAATATAEDNALCTAIEPFYWEIGDQSAALASGSVGTNSSGDSVTATSNVLIASASKWIYAMYVVQIRGGASKLNANDVKFLNFTSGYTNMGSDTTSATCTAPASGADSIANCLTLSGPNGPFNGQNASTTGVFDYDSGHEENHAGQFQPEISGLDTSLLGPAIVAELGLTGTIKLTFTQPLLAGGIVASASDYAAILRGVLSNQLLMYGALGTSPVCAWTGGTACNAAFSPVVSEQWHYSIGHWVEDDPSQKNDGAFSSPGAFGFYPWIEQSKRYYGVISRYGASGGAIQQGVASAQCGALVRHAWDTGVQQMGQLPE
jgi:Bacterial Ig-like domain (group 2)